MDRPRGGQPGGEGGGLERRGAHDSPGERYRIRLRGHLDRRWHGWLEAFDMVHEGDGTTLLTGLIADQPALHGLLIRIRDLGLPIISIQSVDDATGPPYDERDGR